MGSRRLPKATVVVGLATMMPELRKPNRASSRPMPAAMAEYNSVGMAATTCLITPATVSATNSAPERNTAPSATCQEMCMPLTTT